MRQKLEKISVETINKDDRISEVIKKVPEAVPIMMKHGIHCVGCHAAFFETIEQGAQAHGIDDNQISKLVQEINSAKKKK